jgi:hypothetical protein
MTETLQPAPQYIKAESVEPAETVGIDQSEQSSTTNTDTPQYYTYLFLMDENPLRIVLWLNLGPTATMSDDVTDFYIKAKEYGGVGPMMVRTPSPVIPQDLVDYLEGQDADTRQVFFSNAAVPIKLLMG